MKKIVIALVVLFLLVGAGIAAVKTYLTPERIEQMVKEKTREATGREIAFTGARAVFFPSIGLRLENVTVSNASWAKAEHMVSLGELDVSLALMPLLDKKVEVDRFIIKKPAINLETTADGKTNWDFGGAKKEAGGDAPASGAAATGQDFSVTLGTFEISDGSLSYVDGAKGTTRAVEDIDVKIDFPTLQSALALQGALTYQQKRIDLDVKLEKPMALAEGETSPGLLKVKTEDFSAEIGGAFATKGTVMKGDIKADVAALPALLAWMGGTAEQAMSFSKASFSSTADITTEAVKLEGMQASLDDITANGDMRFGFAGKPDIHARLSINKISLDRFMAREKAGAGGGDAAPSGGQKGWDDTPMDFGALKKVDADVVLDTQGFSLKGADVGPSRLTAKLKGGVLQFSSSEASLFDGTFSSALTVNAAAATPALSFDFSMAGVQAKPVLTTFADFKKLSGLTDAKVAVTSAGASQKAIINNLAGNGSVVFRDGALEGIDLVNIAKLIQSRLTDMSVGQGKTEFIETGGTFTIVKGVAANNDFRMKGPLVQASGAGNIDLPQKYISYRVKPILTASSAEDGAKGIGVPVDIKGPFSNIKVKPDYASAVTQVLENPEAAKDAARAVRDQGRELRGAIKDIKKDPAKAIEGILGGGLFGGAQAPAPQPEEAPPADAMAPAPATEETATP